MQNRTLSLSLLISAALAIPSLAMAAPVDMATADMNTDVNAMPADDTLQEEAVGPNGELLTTQPYVESNESEEGGEATGTGNPALDEQYDNPNYQSPTADDDSSMSTDMNNQ